MAEVKNISEKEKQAETVSAAEDTEDEDEAVDTLLVLSKTVKFEGQEYKEIDLSGLNDITTRDLKLARRMMNNSGSSLEFYTERSVEFACYIASIITGKPVTLFDSMPAKDGIALKNMVTHFLY